MCLFSVLYTVLQAGAKFRGFFLIFQTYMCILRRLKANKLDYRFKSMLEGNSINGLSSR